MPTPSLVLVSGEHLDQLRAGLARYEQDYDLHTATSCAEALGVAERIRASGGQVALFVSDSRLPDSAILTAFHAWRTVVPTARRMIAAHVDWFLEDAPRLRGGMATGTYDAYLLMPQGPRDEEFHHAVSELLSDWGSTVAAPEVESVRIVTPQVDGLTPADPRLPGSDGTAAPRPRSRRRRRPLGPRGPPAGRAVPLGSADVRRAHRTALGARRRAGGLRPGHRRGPRAGRRPRHRGRGPRRARRRGLRRLRGALHGGARSRGRRGPGGDLLDDPQLPRLPARALRDAAGPTRPHPGAPLRHPLPHRLAGRPDAGRARRRAARAVHRPGRGPRALGAGRQRGGLPQAACRAAGGAGRCRGQLRRGDDGRARDDRPGRLRGRGRQLRRAGRGTPGALRAIGHRARPTRRTGLDDVVLPGRRDRLQPSDHRACAHPGGRRRRGGAAAAPGPGGRPRGTRETVAAGGLFLLLGAEPHCDWLPPEVDRDDRGFVLTGREVPRDRWVEGLPPPELTTTVPGVFAAGDIRAGSMKRVAAATGEGASVVPLVHTWLAGPTPTPVVEERTPASVTRPVADS